jgi:hypothetical protein
MVCGYFAGILNYSTGLRNQVGIGLSYRTARLHRLAESIPGLLKSLKFRAMWSHGAIGEGFLSLFIAPLATFT